MSSTSHSRLNGPRFIKLCVANWLLYLYVFSMPALLDAGFMQSGAGHAPTGWAVCAFALGMVLPGPLGAWLMEQRSRKGVFLRSMLLLGLLPTLRKNPLHHAKLLFACGCVLTAVVCFTRIWMGAHFLTDVTMGWLIALGVTALSVYLFYFDKKFFNTLWKLVSETPNPFNAKKSAGK